MAAPAAVGVLVTIFIVCGFYAVTEEALTTVAHGTAFLVGVGISKLHPRPLGLDCCSRGGNGDSAGNDDIGLATTETAHQPLIPSSSSKVSPVSRQ